MAWQIGILTEYDPEKRYTQGEMDALGEIYVIVDGDLPTGYTPITSIENWIKIGDFLGYDYKFIRARLQSYGAVDDVTYNNYTSKQRWQICIRKATNNLQRRLNVLGSDYNYYMALFDNQSRECRKERFQYAKSIFLKNVQPLWVFKINAILERDRLDYQYEVKGIEELVIGNTDLVEALFNFIMATPLSYYQANLPALALLGVHDEGGVLKDILGNPVGKYETEGILAMPLEFLPEATITNKTDLINTIMACLRDGIFNGG